MWMMTGTAQKRKYILIGDVCRQLPESLIEALLPFHALTGSDTTSYMCGHTKRTAWKVFNENHHLLVGLGEGILTPSVSASAEEFVCKVYGMETLQTTDSVHHVMFGKGCKPDQMPPSSDALRLHIQRAHYQSMAWKRAHCQRPNLPDPTELGWKRNVAGLQPFLMSLNPIPESCIEPVSCSCQSKCWTMRYSCRKAKIGCTTVCACRTEDGVDSCFNDNQ